MYSEKVLKSFGVTQEQIERNSYGICGFCPAFDYDYGQCTVDNYACPLNDTENCEVEYGID